MPEKPIGSLHPRCRRGAHANWPEAPPVEPFLSDEKTIRPQQYGLIE